MEQVVEANSFIVGSSTGKEQSQLLIYDTRFLLPFGIFVNQEGIVKTMAIVFVTQCEQRHPHEIGHLGVFELSPGKSPVKISTADLIGSMRKALATLQVPENFDVPGLEDELVDLVSNFGRKF